MNRQNLIQSVPCPICAGRGWTSPVARGPVVPCRPCDGSGRRMDVMGGGLLPYLSSAPDIRTLLVRLLDAVGTQKLAEESAREMGQREWQDILAGQRVGLALAAGAIEMLLAQPPTLPFRKRPRPTVH